MKSNATTYDEFFAEAGERESDLRQLDALIVEVVPELDKQFVSGMSITMIGYGMFHYKSVSGREGDWPVIGLANQKNYISLYICAIRDGKYLAELYGDKLGKVNNGRSCIRFKKVADLNLTEIKNILREAADWHKKQPAASKTS